MYLDDYALVAMGAGVILGALWKIGRLAARQ